MKKHFANKRRSKQARNISHDSMVIHQISLIEIYYCYEIYYYYEIITITITALLILISITILLIILILILNNKTIIDAECIQIFKNACVKKHPRLKMDYFQDNNWVEDLIMGEISPSIEQAFNKYPSQTQLQYNRKIQMTFLLQKTMKIVTFTKDRRIKETTFKATQASELKISTIVSFCTGKLTPQDGLDFHQWLVIFWQYLLQAQIANGHLVLVVICQA